MKTREQELKSQKELAKRVMETVADFTEIPVAQIVSSSRKANVMEARHLSMYFIRAKTDMLLVEIARMHNKKSHVPVHHGLNKILHMSSTERGFSQRLAKLKARIDLIKPAHTK